MRLALQRIKIPESSLQGLELAAVLFAVRESQMVWLLGYLIVDYERGKKDQLASELAAAYLGLSARECTDEYCIICIMSDLEVFHIVFVIPFFLYSVRGFAENGCFAIMFVLKADPQAANVHSAYIIYILQISLHIAVLFHHQKAYKKKSRKKIALCSSLFPHALYDTRKPRQMFEMNRIIPWFVQDKNHLKAIDLQ